MKISIFGTGYVGLVTGTCLAEVGHEVICVDIDEEKIQGLINGKMPIYEPGLEELVKKNVAEKRLNFTSKHENAILSTKLIFIAVGTPSAEDGSADLNHVMNVAKTIALHSLDKKILIIKSTVPIGTNDKVRALVKQIYKEEGKPSLDFDICSNPEFLKEGCAIEDFNRAERIIIGSDNKETEEIMAQCYSPFTRKKQKLLIMSPRAAEMTKYAANAMLATKISFMNEMSRIAERAGVDIEQVRHGIGSDSRIGYEFIYPGCGYGGSCFPKDVKALINMSRELNLDSPLISSVDEVNKQQKLSLFNKLYQILDEDISGKRIALWGLSFKPDTDDMREAPSRVLMENIWQEKGIIQAYDPIAMEECKRLYPEKKDLLYTTSPLEALNDAEILVICSEWKEFYHQDLEKIKSTLKRPIILDGRNIFDPQEMSNKGIEYYGIGRGLSLTL